MKKITFKIEGTMPLMLNNPQTVNPFNEYTKALKEITAKRKKTDEDTFEIFHLKFLASIYQNSKGAYIIPCDSFKKSLECAAKEVKLGKKFEQSVQIFQDAVIDFADNNKTPEELWNGGSSQYVDIREGGVRGVGGAVKIPVCRFIIPEWSTQIEVHYDETQVDEKDILTAIDASGQRHGVGTYRKKYGKFIATKIKNTK